MTAYPVRIEDAADRLGVVLGYVLGFLYLVAVAPLAAVWCLGLNCLGWVLDNWRAIAASAFIAAMVAGAFLMTGCASQTGLLSPGVERVCTNGVCLAGMVVK